MSRKHPRDDVPDNDDVQSINDSEDATTNPLAFAAQELQVAREELAKLTLRWEQLKPQDDDGSIEKLMDDLKSSTTHPTDQPHEKQWQAGALLVDAMRLLGDMYDDDEDIPYRLQLAPKKRQRPPNPAREQREDGDSIEDGEPDAKAIIQWASKTCTLPLFQKETLPQHKARVGRVITYFVCNPQLSSGDADDAVSIDYSEKNIKLVVGFLFDKVFGPTGVAYANKLIQDLQRITDNKWESIKARKTLTALVDKPNVPTVLHNLYAAMLETTELEHDGLSAIANLLKVNAAVNVCRAWKHLETQVGEPGTASETHQGGDDQNGLNTNNTTLNSLKSWITTQKQDEDPAWEPPALIGDDDGLKGWLCALKEVLWSCLHPDDPYDTRKWRRLLARGQAAYELSQAVHSPGIFALMPPAVLRGWSDLNPKHVHKWLSTALKRYHTGSNNSVQMNQEMVDGQKEMKQMAHRLSKMIVEPLLDPSIPKMQVRRIRLLPQDSLREAVERAYIESTKAEEEYKATQEAAIMAKTGTSVVASDTPANEGESETDTPDEQNPAHMALTETCTSVVASDTPRNEGDSETR